MPSPDLGKLKVALADPDISPLPWNANVEEYDTERDGTVIAGLITIDPIERTIHDTEYAESEDWPRDLANAQLLVAAVNATPALIDEIERLRGENATLKSDPTGSYAMGEQKIVSLLGAANERIKRLRGEVAEITGKYALMAKAFPTVVEQGEQVIAKRDRKVKADELERVALSECSTVFPADLPHITQTVLLEIAAELRKELV